MKMGAKSSALVPGCDFQLVRFSLLNLSIISQKGPFLCVAGEMSRVKS